MKLSKDKDHWVLHNKANTTPMYTYCMTSKGAENCFRLVGEIENWCNGEK
jgi:hypothetical protein